MELLYDVGDLVWSLTGYGIHDHVFGLIKKALKKPFDPHTRCFNCLKEMRMMWEFGVLEPLGTALEKKEDKGTHTHWLDVEAHDGTLHIAWEALCNPMMMTFLVDTLL